MIDTIVLTLKTGMFTILTTTNLVHQPKGSMTLLATIAWGAGLTLPASKTRHQMS